MSWTPPRTYVVDEVLTAPILNTDHRDNLLAISHPYDYAPADVDVANTVTETSLWSKVITGGDLGANGLLRLEMFGDMLLNNVSTDSGSLRLKFGGNLIILAVIAPGTVSASRYEWVTRIYMGNRAATNAQYANLEFLGNRNAGGLPSGFEIGRAHV